MNTENPDALPLEVANNRRYLRALAQRLGKPLHITVSANEKWLENVPHAGLTHDDFGPLVARIGLDVEDDILGRDFYIGARWLPRFEREVRCWDAPVASIFYDPGQGAHELDSHVVVRRTLLAKGMDVVQVHDAWESVVSAEDSPFVVETVAVAEAPMSPTSRTRRKAAPRAVTPLPAPPIQARPAQDHGVETARVITPPTPAAIVRRRLRDGMRAADAVDFALHAPRSEALNSVLSTLQPDQYRLVTHPGDDPLVIQGHPGTGKTIIAIHRAAYLVSQERPADERVSRLLLLGPTDEWVRHVSAIAATLDVHKRVSVKAMTTWFEEISGLKKVPSTSELDGSADDVGKFVRAVVMRAAKAAINETPWASGPRGRRDNLHRLYDVLRRGGTARERIELGDLSTRWIRTLPPFKQAIKRRRYSPLFAQIALAVYGTSALQFDHVIVDEAQDVAGLEWEIVKACNPPQRWTLVGDMNQRRHDFGDASWGQLIARLNLTSLRGPVEPAAIERGYRSTQPILDFAKPLLPRSERGAQSLQQDGPAPTVTRKVGVGERDAAVVREAERLLAAHGGTVAIIATDADLDSLQRALLSSGWRRGDRTGDWRMDSERLALRTPVTARGVEFDGVVVVEPGAFPQNLGRVGPLYTSLTRANRELAVVHSAALPDPLRRHGRH